MELGGILEVLELVNLAFKECLGLCRRCKASLSRSKGPRTRPGPAVKAFDSDNAQPASPGEAGQDQTWNQMYPLRPVFV